MISEATLKYLIAHRVKDANVLFRNKRFPAAVYIAGYAVEVALKYRICKTFDFLQGFPETREELAGYLDEFRPLPVAFQLREIRNHDLNKLLKYSGLESRVKTSFSSEWRIVESWAPDKRYKKLRIIGKTAQAFLQAVNRLIKEFS